MRILVYVLLAVVAAITVLSFIGLNIDLAIADLFFNPATRRFLAFGNPYLSLLRDNGAIAIGTCVVVVISALLRLLPWRLPGIPPRNAIALALSLIIGPGILVNAILKPYGGRPRPIEVTEFGGSLQYVDWWNPTGTCEGNCSFMSGEASTAAWMFGPAMLVPPPWRAYAIAAAAAFTATIGMLRVASGAHFFTDALIGALSTILILLAMNRLFGIRSTDPRANGS